MDSGGQAAGSFADSFMNTYLGIQQNRRENANQEIINKLRQKQVDDYNQKQAAGEAIKNMLTPQYQSYIDQTDTGNGPGNADQINLSPLGQQRLQKVVGGIPQQIDNPAYQPPSPMTNQQQPSFMERLQQQFQGVPESQTMANPEYSNTVKQATSLMGQLGGETTQPKLDQQALMKMIAQNAAFDPSGALKQAVELQTKEKTINPVVSKLMDAQQKGTLNEQGQAILKALGYDFFTQDVANTDFATFKAGYKKNNGESNEEFNTRVSKNWHDNKVSEATKISVFKNDLTNPSEDKFKNWADPIKENQFKLKMITGKDPKFGFGDRSSYNAFNHEYGQYMVKNNISPADASLIQADYRAGDMSLKNMSKQEAPMSAFVLNINKQISKVEEMYKANDRTGLRLLDTPLRDLKVKALGSGDEAVKASYLLEISNEIGKLSSGASGSVQQLSDSAKEDWKKVHDVNLSLKEITKVLNGTREQANMRMQSWRDAKEEVRKSLGSIGETNAPSSNVKPFDVTIPSGIDPQKIANELAKRLKRK